MNERLIELAGTVKAVLYNNEENGYTVIKLETTDGESLTVVGCLAAASVGEALIVRGEMGAHPSYGQQFKAEYCERSMPTTANAIYEFLASRAIKGVGPATASLLVTNFGRNTLEVIEREPERLAEIRGISMKKAHEISAVYRKQIVIRRLMEFLGNYEIKPVYAIRLYREYGDEAMDLLEENPYIIAREAIGASFSEADSFALNLGFDDDGSERVAAAVLFELKHNTRNGHSFIPLEVLISVTSALIEVPAEPIEEAIEVLIDSGDLVRGAIAGKEACYLSSLYEAEVYAAERLREMVSMATPPPRRAIDTLISEIEDEQSVSYAQLQLYSLRIAATQNVMVLTGGPGTGKTTTVRAIVSLYEKLGLKTILTAPTGRAAKRMSELAGREALTIHRLLEAAAPENGEETIFHRDEEEPLKCDAVILDECSMVDITLFQALLRALSKKCRLVLVGDADQLPSVGAGNVFNDIIRSGIVETVRLTEIFRQTATSRIVSCAHMINRGDHPDFASNTSDSDFFFLRRTSSRAALETIVELCSTRLPEKMGIPVTEIQVLSPTRRGEVGTKNINALLQAALNPSTPEKKEKVFGEILFRQGDRVMQIRNNYDIMWSKPETISYPDSSNGMTVPQMTFSSKPENGTGIFNGDIGYITSIDYESEIIYVLYDDRLAAYGFELLSELEHAYAMTVHKSQGSEYGAVILLALDGAPQLLSRRVLYTAVTRARNLLVVVGSDTTIINMIDNHKVSRRFSGLRARLVELSE